MAKESGINGMKNENDSSGVGFIIIPDNIDRDLYIQDVYRTGRVSIFGGYGHSNFYDVLIDSEALQEIQFPKINDKYGTPVVWVNIPKHNEVIVISALKYDKSLANAAEFSRKFTKTYKQNIVNFEMNAKDGKINLSVNSNDKKSKFEIFVNSKSNDSEFILKVSGQTIFHSSDRCIVISEKSVETVITDKKGIVIAKSVMDSSGEVRFTYEDEFKNKQVFSKTSTNFRADDSKKIDFGDGKEKAVLGDTLVDLLEKYDAAFSKMTVNTSFGPSSTRVNEAEFAEIKEQFKNILSKLVNLD